MSACGLAPSRPSRCPIAYQSPAQSEAQPPSNEARMRTFVMRLANTAFVALFLAGNATASEELWARLKAGGHVVLIRHTITTPGAGDPTGMRIVACSTTRNMTTEGRAHEHPIIVVWIQRGIPI